eukprot:g2081.t1
MESHPKPLIYDLKTKGEDSTFDSKNILKAFINPLPNVRHGVRVLHQPDGSVIERTLPETVRSIPQFIIFDTFGQEAYQALMQLEDEYYLTACEKKILETKAAEIGAFIPDNASIFDLGCGSMEKTKILVDHLRKSGKRGIKVHGVDIDRPYLEIVLTGLMEDQRKNKAPNEDEFEFIGLYSTYEQALSFMKETKRPRILLVMGSTIGSMNRNEAVDFLLQFQENSMEADDCFCLGFDKRNDPAIIARAYQDTKGHLYSMCKHGLENLEKMLGDNSFSLESFKVLRGYNDIEGCNEIFYMSLVDQKITIPPPYSGSDKESVEVHLKQGELIDVITSFKYSQSELESVVGAAKFQLVGQWSDPKDMYWFCLLKPIQNSNQC